VLALLGALARAEDRLEYQVKALFLVRIAQFAAWPETALPPPPAPFVIGIVGDDPFGPLMEEAVRGERVAGRTVAVRRFADAGAMGPAHLLFVSASRRGELDAVLARAAGALTVADFAGFVGGGGAVELFLDRGRVRFRVDRGAARRAGIELSSKLLRSAALVRED
jgi:hypothetical protein